MTNNVYWTNFKKYEKLVHEYKGEDYYGLMEEVKKVIIPRQDSSEDSSAVVVFGFSGNGKSTWIREFCEQNDDYVVISMDAVVRKLSDSLGRRVDGYEITKAFGEKLDEICSSGKKVVVDGNFLNLLTRSALTDSLHTYGYDVTLVDLTLLFDITIQKRILDEAGRVLGIKITEDNYEEYCDNSVFLAMKNRVLDYHNQERERSAFDEQILLGATSIGVEKVVKVGPGAKDDVANKKM